MADSHGFVGRSLQVEAIATRANKATRAKNCVDISLLYFFHPAVNSPFWRKQVVAFQEVEELSWLIQVDLVRKQD